MGSGEDAITKDRRIDYGRLLKRAFDSHDQTLFG